MKNVKSKEIPSSIFARIKTQPDRVVEEVLGCVPIEVLADPSVTVVDPAMGGGDYLAAVLRIRLDAGVPREDAVKTLYGYESNTVYMNHALWKMNLHGANLAIMALSGLKKVEMKFDVVIGNPPYQDPNNAAKDQKLWMKFVEVSFNLLKEGGYLSLVTPSTIVGATKNPAKYRKRFTTDFSMDSLDHTANDYFSVGVDICSWAARKVPYSGVTVVRDSNGKREIDLRTELPVPSDKVASQALAEKIYSIVKSGKVPVLHTEIATPDLPEVASGSYKTYVSGRNKFYTTDSPTPDHGRWKLVFSYSATYKQWFVTQDNVCGSHRLVFVDTPEQGVKIGETLLTPLMQFYLDTWRKTSGYTPAVKNRGCLPDLTGLATAETYELFDLSREEIELVESHYTEYKQIDRVL